MLYVLKMSLCLPYCFLSLDNKFNNELAGFGVEFIVLWTEKGEGLTQLPDQQLRRLSLLERLHAHENSRSVRCVCGMNVYVRCAHACVHPFIPLFFLRDPAEEVPRHDLFPSRAIYVGVGQRSREQRKARYRN